MARVPGLDFSFSGVKTALLYAVRDLGEAELAERRADLAASYQRAIVRALDAAAARRRPTTVGIERIAVVGGVAANCGAPRRTARMRRFAPLASAPTTPR